MGIGIELDLVYVKGKLEDSDNVFDLMFAVFIGYMLVDFFPTFVVNFVIVLKEATLNQFAWRRSQDYGEGLLFNKFNTDFLSILGIDEDWVYYTSYFS